MIVVVTIPINTPSSSASPSASASASTSSSPSPPRITITTTPSSSPSSSAHHHQHITSPSAHHHQHITISTSPSAHHHQHITVSTSPSPPRIIITTIKTHQHNVVVHPHRRVTATNQRFSIAPPAMDSTRQTLADKGKLLARFLLLLSSLLVADLSQLDLHRARKSQSTASSIRSSPPMHDDESATTQLNGALDWVQVSVHEPQDEILSQRYSTEAQCQENGRDNVLKNTSPNILPLLQTIVEEDEQQRRISELDLRLNESAASYEASHTAHEQSKSETTRHEIETMHTIARLKEELHKKDNALQVANFKQLDLTTEMNSLLNTSHMYRQQVDKLELELQQQRDTYERQSTCSQCFQTNQDAITLNAHLWSTCQKLLEIDGDKTQTLHTITTQLTNFKQHMKLIGDKHLRQDEEHKQHIRKLTSEVKSLQSLNNALKDRLSMPHINSDVSISNSHTDSGCDKLTKSLFCIDQLMETMEADLFVYKSQKSQSPTKSSKVELNIDKEESDNFNSNLLVDNNPSINSLPPTLTMDQTTTTCSVDELQKDMDKRQREIKLLKTQLSDQQLENKTLSMANRRAKELLVAVAMGTFEKTLYAEVECLNIEVHAGQALAARLEQLNMEKIRIVLERDGFRDTTRLLEQRVFELSEQLKQLEQSQNSGTVYLTETHNPFTQSAGVIA